MRAQLGSQVPGKTFQGIAGGAESSRQRISDAAGSSGQGQDHSGSLPDHDPCGGSSREEMGYHTIVHRLYKIMEVHFSQWNVLDIVNSYEIECNIDRAACFRHCS